MNTKVTALVALTALTLAGCGGGGGGGSAGSGGGSGGGGSSSATTVSGRAADGYLSGATVCLDLNTNKRCDTGEPSGTTGAGGAFTLDVPAGVDASAAPLLVEVGVGTIDEDTGVAVPKPFVLSSPAGKGSFVSPMTTAVQALLERNPALTADEAAAQVKQSVGAADGVSLFEDYVAAKDDGTNADAGDYARLHKVAQVTAKVLAENQEAIEAAAVSQGLDPEQVRSALLTLVTNQVLDQLQQSAEVVDTQGGSFDIDTVTVGQADTTDLAAQVEEAETQAGFQVANAFNLITQGVSWLWAEADVSGDYYEYGTIAEGASQNVLEEQVFSFDGVGWMLLDGEPDTRYLLTAGGWYETTDDISAYTVSAPGDDSASLRINGQDFIKAVAVELDVSGELITDYLGFEAHTLFAQAITGSPVFSSGANVYQASFLYEGDQYLVDSWQDCLAQYADPYGNCNIIYAYSTDTHATDLSEVIYPTGVTPDTNYFGVGDGLEVRVIEGGELLITDQNDAGAESTGSWSLRTVHGVEVMMLDLPAKFADRLWDEGTPFLAVQNGYVRRGHFHASGTPDCIECQGELLFNQTALEDIKANLAIVAELRSCETGDTNGFTASFADFESAVQACSTSARAITSADVAGLTWTSVDSGETLVFSGDGTAVLDGTEDMTWTLDGSGNLEMRNLAGTYYDVYSLVAEKDNRISVKVYNDDDSDGNLDRTGSDGDIWSAVYTVQ